MVWPACAERVAGLPGPQPAPSSPTTSASTAATRHKLIVILFTTMVICVVSVAFSTCRRILWDTAALHANGGHARHRHAGHSRTTRGLGPVVEAGAAVPVTSSTVAAHALPRGPCQTRLAPA